MPNFISRISGDANWMWDTAAPTSGTWNKGDTVFNSAPDSSGAPDKWICVASGSPGTWAPVAGPSANTVSTVSAAANIPLVSDLVQIGTGGFNVTLSAPTSALSKQIDFVNPTASPVTLVAGAGTAIVGNVTLSANSSASAKNIGTSWYRL